MPWMDTIPPEYPELAHNNDDDNDNNIICKECRKDLKQDNE